MDGEIILEIFLRLELQRLERLLLEDDELYNVDYLWQIALLNKRLLRVFRESTQKILSYLLEYYQSQHDFLIPIAPYSEREYFTTKFIAYDLSFSGKVIYYKIDLLKMTLVRWKACRWPFVKK